MIDALLSQAAHHPQGWRCKMRVCGQYEARQYIDHWQPTHLISVKKPEGGYRGPPFPAERHLILAFDDVSDPSHPGAPTHAHLDAVLAFVDAMPEEASALIHCLQGLSRSTALALGLLARDVQRLRAAYLLHGLRPQAVPNPLLIRLWDERLALHGVLVKEAGGFPCQVWRRGDGLGNFAHRRRKRGQQ